MYSLNKQENQSRNVPQASGSGSDRSPGLVGEQPPTCNTGALSAKASKASIDHFAFTVKGCTVQDVQKVLGGEWQQGKGWRGYRDSWCRREGEAVTLMGANMKGYPGEVHVQLSGAAIRSMEMGALYSLHHWVKSKQGHMTRLDVALDDFSGLLDIDRINQAMKDGQIVSRSREYQCIESGDLKTGKGGKSIYIGSAQSETRYAIYDKAAEQTKKGKPFEGSWTRLETRYQDDRADQVMSALCESTKEHLHIAITAFLVAALDFRDITPEMKSWEKSRAPQLGWWKEFTDSIKGVRLTVEKASHSIEKAAEWVSGSLAPMLAVIVANKALGWIWLEQQIDKGKEEWKEKHRYLSTASLPVNCHV